MLIPSETSWERGEEARRVGWHLGVNQRLLKVHALALPSCRGLLCTLAWLYECLVVHSAWSSSAREPPRVPGGGTVFPVLEA